MGGGGVRSNYFKSGLTKKKLSVMANGEFGNLNNSKLLDNVSNANRMVK